MQYMRLSTLSASRLRQRAAPFGPSGATAAIQVEMRARGPTYHTAGMLKEPVRRSRRSQAKFTAAAQARGAQRLAELEALSHARLRWPTRRWLPQPRHLGRPATRCIKKKLSGPESPREIRGADFGAAAGAEPELFDAGSTWQAESQSRPSGCDRSSTASDGESTWGGDER